MAKEMYVIRDPLVHTKMMLTSREDRQEMGVGTRAWLISAAILSLFQCTPGELNQAQTRFLHDEDNDEEGGKKMETTEKHMILCKSIFPISFRDKHRYIGAHQFKVFYSIPSMVVRCLSTSLSENDRF